MYVGTVLVLIVVMVYNRGETRPAAAEIDNNACCSAPLIAPNNVGINYGHFHLECCGNHKYLLFLFIFGMFMTLCSPNA